MQLSVLLTRDSNPGAFIQSVKAPDQTESEILKFEVEKSIGSLTKRCQFDVSVMLTDQLGVMFYKFLDDRGVGARILH